MPYKDPLTADTVLVRGAIQSPNYVPGVSGWIVRQNGSAEFQNLIARGTIIANQIKTSDLQTVPRLWINNPGAGVDGPNTIFFYKEDQNDATAVPDLARIQGNSFAGQNPGITLKAFGDVSDIDYTGVQIVGGTPGTGAGSVIELTSPDTVDIFSGGQNNGELGLRNNTFPVLDTHNFQALGPQGATGTLALTTANVDVPGASISYATVNPNALVLAWGNWDFQTTTAIGAGGVCVGTLNTDGNDHGQPLAVADASAVGRWSVPTFRPIALPSPGNHTTKLRGRKTINAGAAQANLTQTTLTLLVLDWPQ